MFAACGVYQLTPLKSCCLRHCRSPLSLLLHCGSYQGALRDVRAGAHHGAYCLGCCWSLMALFVVVGVMNLAAMIVLAAVVLAEKLWVHAPTTPAVSRAFRDLLVPLVDGIRGRAGSSGQEGA